MPSEAVPSSYPNAATPPKALRVATFTLSDTRTPADDESGRVLEAELRAAGLVVSEHRILPDDGVSIRDAVRALVAAKSVDAIVTSGGTGIAPRDVTIETLAPLFDRTLDGFGEAFRRLSWDEVGPRSILSRATAGVIGTILVFALPGSTKAVRLGVRELVAPVLPHAVDLANGRTSHATKTATRSPSP